MPPSVSAKSTSSAKPAILNSLTATGGGELVNRSYRNCAADDRGIVTSQAVQVWKLKWLSNNYIATEKSFSGDHSKNLKQSNEKSPDT